LAQLKERGVEVPEYDRRKLKAGILHFGVGNFFRAHQATYIEDLLNKKRDYDLDWGIIGVNVVPQILKKRSEEHRQSLLVSLTVL
jgi:mannitol 2-dehydrogenase